MCIALCVGASGDISTLPDFKLEGQRNCVRCRAKPAYRGIYQGGRRDRVLTALEHDGTISHELTHRWLCRRDIDRRDVCDGDHSETALWACPSECERALIPTWDTLPSIRPDGGPPFVDPANDQESPRTLESRAHRR